MQNHWRFPFLKDLRITLHNIDKAILLQLQSIPASNNRLDVPPDVCSGWMKKFLTSVIFYFFSCLLVNQNFTTRNIIHERKPSEAI